MHVRASTYLVLDGTPEREHIQFFYNPQMLYNDFSRRFSDRNRDIVLERQRERGILSNFMEHYSPSQNCKLLVYFVISIFNL